MKKNLSLLSIMLVFFCMIFSTTAHAEDDYTFVTGSNSMPAAADISLNEEYAASLNGDEVLYFQFTTPSDKGFFDFYSKNINIKTHSWSGDVQVQFELLDAVSEIKSRHRLGKGAEASDNLPLNTAQTYYIKVYNKSVDKENPAGNFKFRVSYTQDKESDAKETAAEISLNKKTAATLDGSADIDYFKVNTKNESSFILTAQNVNIPTHSWSSNLQFYVRIKSEIDEIVAELRMTPGNEKNVKTDLQPNTNYYIEAGNPEPGQGQYTFSLEENSKRVSSILMKKETAVVAKGARYGLLRSVLPASASNKKLSWSSQDSSIASVNANGQVKGINVGTTVIKAVSTDGSNIEASCQVIVKPARTKITRAKKEADRNISITVSPQNNVSGIQYQLSRSITFRRQSAYLAGGQETTARTGMLAKGRTYFFRARMYYDYNGKRYYGSWSKIKAVKTGRETFISGSFGWNDVS